jgi:hypothetical protein
MEGEYYKIHKCEQNDSILCGLDNGCFKIGSARVFGVTISNRTSTRSREVVYLYDTVFGMTKRWDGVWGPAASSQIGQFRVGGGGLPFSLFL